MSFNQIPQVVKPFSVFLCGRILLPGGDREVSTDVFADVSQWDLPLTVCFLSLPVSFLSFHIYLFPPNERLAAVLSLTSVSLIP